MATFARCSDCGALNSGTAAECYLCASHRLLLACPSCGTGLQNPVHVHCPSCGASYHGHPGGAMHHAGDGG
ncbi:MAG TPA: hypothetical protein VHI13_03710 [Candidatus Kapabacteria bacterium]|nr:hypothetical protein [Candidatus Kapabacteria bacterium]